MSIILKSIPNIAGIIPKNIRVRITNKAVSYSLKKYANIRVENKEVIESRSCSYWSRGYGKTIAS